MIGVADLKDHVPVNSVIAFSAGEEELAIKPSDLSEIIEYSRLVPVPKAPGFIKGVANSHGRVVSVMDLWDLIGEPKPGTDAKRRIAVLSDEEFMLGILMPFDLKTVFYEGELRPSVKKAGIRFFKVFEARAPDGQSFEVSLLETEGLYSFIKDFMKKWAVNWL